MKKLLCLTLSLLSSNIFCGKYNLSNCKEMMEKFEQERFVRPASTSSNSCAETVAVIEAVPAVVAEVAPEVVTKASPAVVATVNPLDDAVAKFKQENPIAVEFILTCMQHRDKFIAKNNEATLRLKGLDITLLPDWDSAYGQAKVVFSDDRCHGIDADKEVTLYSKILNAINLKQEKSFGAYFKVESACKCRDIKDYECVFSVPKDIAIAMQKEVTENK